MIHEEDLMEAIAECQGQRNPSSATCIKLAAYYTILNQMNGQTHEVNKQSSSYSFASAPNIRYSQSRFSTLVKEKGIENCFPVLDEAMDVLLVVNPKLYNSIIRNLEGL